MGLKLLVQVLGGQAPGTHGSKGSSTISAVPALLLPDAATYGCFTQLFGAAGMYNQVLQLTIQALRQQLPLASTSSSNSSSDSSGNTGSTSTGKSRWTAADLQCVLASAACAWLAAGQQQTALAMLDGLVAAGYNRLDSPVLAEAVCHALDKDVSFLLPLRQQLPKQPKQLPTQYLHIAYIPCTLHLSVRQSMLPDSLLSIVLVQRVNF